MPGSGRRGRFLRCAERRGAIATRPRLCSTVFVLGLQRFVKVLDREVPIPRPILLDDKLDAVHRRAPPGGSPTSPINQALRPVGLVPLAQPAKMPLADPQKLRGLHAAQSPASIPLQRLNIARHSHLGSHPDPPVWNISKNRTDRLLPNPDIPSATDRRSRRT